MAMFMSTFIITIMCIGMHMAMVAMAIGMVMALVMAMATVAQKQRKGYG